jgi:hypothetical protein
MAAKTKRAAKQGSKPSAASKMAHPIPAGYPPITPYLRVRNAQQALAL